MAAINKPSQPLIPPTDVEEVEEIATNVAEAAIAADDTHAPLVDDKVPAANLPSYVDDVLNFDSAEDFPDEGEEGKIYVANDTNLTYRWSGVAYIQVGGASLAAGYGIDIENDIVSVDMDYISNSLDHVTEAELADGLAAKANIADTYTKAQVDAAVAPKANTADVESALSGKQDTLVSGTNIKTINGQSILSAGDIEAAPMYKDIPVEYSTPLSAYDNDIEQWLLGVDVEYRKVIAEHIRQNGPWSYHDSDGTFVVVDLNPAHAYAPEDNSFSLLFYIYTNLPVELWEGEYEPYVHAPVDVWSYSVDGIDEYTGDYNSTATHVSGTRYATTAEVQSMIAAAIGNVLNEEF